MTKLKKTGKSVGDSIWVARVKTEYQSLWSKWKDGCTESKDEMDMINLKSEQPNPWSEEEDDDDIYY